MNGIRQAAGIASMLLICAACSMAQQKPVSTAAHPPANDPKNMEEACELPQYQCTKDPISVSMIRKDGSKFQVVLPAPTPLIQNGYIYVISGQTVYVEADVDKDQLVNLHLVPSIVHPEKTLTFKLEQTSDAKTGSMMLFSVQNPFDKSLKYHAGMMPLDRPSGATEDSIYKTSTCPAVAKGGGFESWPYPIFQLVLGDLHLLEPDSKENGLCIF